MIKCCNFTFACSCQPPSAPPTPPAPWFPRMTFTDLQGWKLSAAYTSHVGGESSRARVRGERRTPLSAVPCCSECKHAAVHHMWPMWLRWFLVCWGSVGGNIYFSPCCKERGPVGLLTRLEIGNSRMKSLCFGCEVHIIRLRPQKCLPPWNIGALHYDSGVWLFEFTLSCYIS